MRRAKPSKAMEDAFFAANEAFEGDEAPFGGKSLKILEKKLRNLEKS